MRLDPDASRVRLAKWRPCRENHAPVISSFEYPSRRSATFTVFSLGEITRLRRKDAHANETRRRPSLARLERSSSPRAAFDTLRAQTARRPEQQQVGPLSSQPSPAHSAETWALEIIGAAAKSKLSSILSAGSIASPRCRSIPLSHFVFGEGHQAAGRRPALFIGAFGKVLP